MRLIIFSLLLLVCHANVFAQAIKVSRKNGILTIIKKEEINSVIKFKDTTLKRTIYANDQVIYSDTDAVEKETIDSVRYTSKNDLDKQYQRFTASATLGEDSFYKISNAPFLKVTDARINNGVLRDITNQSNRYERIRSWDQYRLMRKAHLYIAVNYTPSYSRNIVLVKAQDNTLNSVANSRSNNETGIYGDLISGALGITMGSSHTLYASYLHADQGFNALGHTIDWATGRPVNAAGNTKYKLKSDNIGLGYNYSKFNSWQPFHCVFDIALYNGTMGGQSIWSGKTALGLSIHPRYSLEFQLMPTIFWNFTNLDNGYLATKLINIGITGGVVFRPYFCTKMRFNK